MFECPSVVHTHVVVVVSRLVEFQRQELFLMFAHEQLRLDDAFALLHLLTKLYFFEPLQCELDLFLEQLFFSFVDAAVEGTRQTARLLLMRGSVGVALHDKLLHRLFIEGLKCFN